MDTSFTLPRRPRGRPSPQAEALYSDKLRAWCSAVKEIDSRLDFKVGTRGWCYLLEAHGLAKGDFDKAEQIIANCRKNGLLPLDICADDLSRAFEGREAISSNDPAGVASVLIGQVESAWEGYTPISFWEGQPYYLELLVEKVDLKSLFAPICHRYRIMHGNARGWSDLNQRAAMMRRFEEAEARGQQPVLLYCGDHDPSGLTISDTLVLNFIDLTFAVEQTYGITWDPKTLIIDRFGLNRDFIDVHSLTWIEGLKTGSGNDLADPSHPDHDKSYVRDYIRQHGARKVEANALVVAADAGRQLLLDTIHKYISPDALAKYAEKLVGPRDALRIEVLRQLREGGETLDALRELRDTIRKGTA